MISQKQRYTRHAVAIMTEWLDDPHGETDRVSDVAMSIVAEAGDGDVVAGLTEVVIGLINLNGQLLVDANARTGVRAEVLLRELAQLAARE